jgi:magnesium-protoporphyrin O-methyltransferase
MPASCCLQSNADTGRLFDWMARLNRLRHRLFGFEANQRQLLDGVRAEGIAGATLLEAGCGPGFLQQRLLKEGAAAATGVDLSAGMLAVARREAERHGLADRSDYLQGDFVQLAGRLPEADIVILDKVVCCYPDWQAMLDVAIARSRRVIALTYPLDRRLTRVMIRLMLRLLDWIHCRYQPYLHDPAQIHAHLQAHGFHPVSGAHAHGWLTEIYVRDGRDRRADPAVQSV